MNQDGLSKYPSRNTEFRNVKFVNKVVEPQTKQFLNFQKSHPLKSNSKCFLKKIDLTL